MKGFRTEEFRASGADKLPSIILNEVRRYGLEAESLLSMQWSRINPWQGGPMPDQKLDKFGLLLICSGYPGLEILLD